MYVGITQRVEKNQFGEIRDVLDQAWTRLLQHLGHIPLPLCTNVESVQSYLDALPLDAVIFSGGNDLAHLSTARNSFQKRDVFEKNIITYCLEREIPILGVCRGAQVLNTYFGGSLVPVKAHAGTRHTVQVEEEEVVVNSYHDWGILKDGLAKELTPLAVDSDGMVEAFYRPGIQGIMWHPEREDALNEIDKKIFRSFLQGKE